MRKRDILSLEISSILILGDLVYPYQMVYIGLSLVEGLKLLTDLYQSPLVLRFQGRLFFLETGILVHVREQRKKESVV